MRPVSEILYLVSKQTTARVRKEIEDAGGRERSGEHKKDWMAVPSGSTTFRFHIIHSVDDALSCLEDHYYSFVVVDDRAASLQKRPSEALAKAFMERVHYAADPDRRFPLSRIIAVLERNEDLAAHAFDLGRLRIATFIVDPFPSALFKFMEQAYDIHPGKTAVCFSGGGMEGFLFELGVMQALNAHLQARSVTDFDIFCGISAGSILAAFLANATEPEDMISAITETGHSTMSPLKPSLLFDPSYQEYFSRAASLLKSVPIRSWNGLVSSLLKAVPIGFFRGEALHQFLKAQLNQANRTDDFRKLKKELYIGATEQDTSAHVVFGTGQWADIPISTAVRASSALTPFFEPVKIRGRYFVDGQYTRTSNFHVAVQRGAKLVVVVDPLIPLRVQEPGYVRRKGGVFGGLQALKAVIHTRFMHGFQAAIENYPNVHFVLFKPEGEEMRLMGGSPLKYNIRTEILNMAYRCAVRKIQRDYEILAGTFAKHGFLLQRHPRLRMDHRQVF
ncbi:MAG: patatin-like phospholipase family protein [Pseudomonadota bacterium]